MWPLLLASSAFANDTPVDPATLPAPVTASLTQHFPGAKIVRASRDDDELELVIDHQGKHLEVSFRQDGTYVESEEKIDASVLPAAVRTAAEAKGKIVSAERITDAGGAVQYEVHVKVGGTVTELKLDEHAAPPASREKEKDEDGDEDEGDEDGDER